MLNFYAAFLSLFFHSIPHIFFMYIYMYNFLLFLLKWNGREQRKGEKCETRRCKWSTKFVRCTATSRAPIGCPYESGSISVFCRGEAKRTWWRRMKDFFVCLFVCLSISDKKDWISFSFCFVFSPSHLCSVTANSIVSEFGKQPKWITFVCFCISNKPSAQLWFGYYRNCSSKSCQCRFEFFERIKKFCESTDECSDFSVFFSCCLSWWISSQPFLFSSFSMESSVSAIHLLMLLKFFFPFALLKKVFHFRLLF